LCDALTDSNFHEEVKAIREAYIKTMQFSWGVRHARAKS
jgi:hypothetical protein